jgi:tRNA threonylcarbamoyladenosine biosynthesis protein TsaB
MCNPSRRPELLLLAIDTALDQTAVCLFDTRSSQVLAEDSEAMQRGHAEALLPMVERVFTSSGIARDAVERVAVTIGPGSFTGLRIGISMARGIALALDVPVVGIGTMAAFAADALIQQPDQPVAVVLDAKNEQVYLQFMTSTGTAQGPAIAMPIADAAKLLRQRPATLTGTASETMRLACSRMGVVLKHVPSGPGPSIMRVAQIGAVADPDRNAALPLYVRAPAITPAKPPAVALSV